MQELNHTLLLIIYRGLLAGSRWPVTGDSGYSGKGQGLRCGKLLNERFPHHARIERDTTGYVLRDLGSRNGTAGHGEALGICHIVCDGDEIELAGASRISFVAGDATPPLSDSGIGIGGVGGAGATTPDRPADTASLPRAQDPRASLLGRSLLLMWPLSAKGVVTREDAVAAVWPDAAGGVTDQALMPWSTDCASGLPSWILTTCTYTVRGHGFRYVSA